MWASGRRRIWHDAAEEGAGVMGKRVKRAGYPMPRADRHMCEERQRARAGR